MVDFGTEVPLIFECDLLNFPGLVWTQILPPPYYDTAGENWVVLALVAPLETTFSDAKLGLEISKRPSAALKFT